MSLRLRVRWTEPRGAYASNMVCNRDVSRLGARDLWFGSDVSAVSEGHHLRETLSGASQAGRDTRPLRWLHRIVRVDFRPRDEAASRISPVRGAGDIFAKESCIRLWTEWVLGGCESEIEVRSTTPSVRHPGESRDPVLDGFDVTRTAPIYRRMMDACSPLMRNAPSRGSRLSSG